MGRKRETDRNETSRSASARETTIERGITEETGTGTENGTEGIDNRKDSEVNLVNVPEPRPVKKRQYNKKSQKQNNVGVPEVTALLNGLFNVVSLRGGEHWQLNEGEGEKIAQPLCNILEKMNVLEKVTNVSDGLALIIATGTVIIPRALISIQIEKSKQTNRKEVKKVNAGNTEQQNRVEETNNKTSNGESTNPTKDTQFNDLLHANSIY